MIIIAYDVADIYIFKWLVLFSSLHTKYLDLIDWSYYYCTSKEARYLYAKIESFRFKIQLVIVSLSI